MKKIVLILLQVPCPPRTLMINSMISFLSVGVSSLIKPLFYVTDITSSINFPLVLFVVPVVLFVVRIYCFAFALIAE